MCKQQNLFNTHIVPGKPGSGNLFDEEIIEDDGPVVCLGFEFENDEARRAYFTEELRKKLNDPEFRNIEGFPIGEDQDILRLSDPPYYTACPNPWIPDFIEEWENEKPEKPEDFQYHREPFAADVSEGKNDPIYNAHSYHTKVPHKAVMRYILHYTEPGDIVFDGFAGTGMTGVAAQMCGDKETVLSLGYQVKDDGTILQEEEDENGRKTWKPFSKLGARKAVLNDLSPAATFIAYNYNTPVNVKEFEREAKRILAEVEEECGWMYETTHTDGISKGKINYTVWSDVFVCPNCSREIIFWEEAIGEEGKGVKDEFQCPDCKTNLSKNNLERAWVTEFDIKVGFPLKSGKQIPVLINYTTNGKRYNKKPDELDLRIINEINTKDIPYSFPVKKIPKGDKTSDPFKMGIIYTHQFYTKRNLWVLSALWNRCHNPWLIKTSILVSSSNLHLNKMRRWQPLKPGGTPGLPGTLFIPATPVELSIFDSLPRKLKALVKAYNTLNEDSNITSTSSFSSVSLSENSCDYLFIDPPFGSNIMYSELNFVWESWLGVLTNNKHEAIENRSQKKTLNDYRNLMTSSFISAYKSLKPGRWMTVEFSNTKASVWNSIQTALTEAGFIVANVSSLDKQQGSFNAVTNTTSVKQDLVISAYKPNGGFEERFQKEAKTEEGVWDFTHTHLGYLPVTKKHGMDLVLIPERDPRILYDQVISYYVRKGYSVPIDSQDFQVGLSQRFSERDGMYFLPEQVAEYDRQKMLLGNKTVQQSLFISDEASAIEWLRSLLREKPQSYQDINPQFMQEISGWSKNEVGLELSTLLEQNFLIYDGKGDVPEQIHSYLSTNWKEMRNLSKQDPALIGKAKGRWYVPDPGKAGDLEKLRERALLKEFEQYKQYTKKLKVFRLEAVRAGFKKAWQGRDYTTIVSVAEKIPSSVLEEDPKLLMWYDQAVTRMGR